MAEKGHGKGEMRRRWKALSQDGSIARLRSEGRLVALYVFLVADWTTCQIRIPLRRAARFMGVYPTAIKRGLEQLLAEGILEDSERKDTHGNTFWLIKKRTQGVYRAHTSGVRPGTRAVYGAHTSGVQSAHEPCTERTHTVYSAHTGCEHNSVLSSGSPVRTSGCTSAETAGAGRKPAPPLREHRRLRDDSGEGTPAGDQATAADS